MSRYFDDISIRGKLTVIVASAVAALTIGVLVSVWISSWREVRADGDRLVSRRGPLCEGSPRGG